MQSKSEVEMRFNLVFASPQNLNLRPFKCFRPASPTLFLSSVSIQTNFELKIAQPRVLISRKPPGGRIVGLVGVLLVGGAGEFEVKISCLDHPSSKKNLGCEALKTSSFSHPPALSHRVCRICRNRLQTLRKNNPRRQKNYITPLQEYHRVPNQGADLWGQKLIDQGRPPCRNRWPLLPLSHPFPTN